MPAELSAGIFFYSYRTALRRKAIGAARKKPLAGEAPSGDEKVNGIKS
jgi:hypothetical protein